MVFIPVFNKDNFKEKKVKRKWHKSDADRMAVRMEDYAEFAATKVLLDNEEDFAEIESDIKRSHYVGGESV